MSCAIATSLSVMPPSECVTKRESHCPPTDIDVGVVVFLFGALSYPADRFDPGKELRKLDRSSQRAIFAFPPVELR